MMVSRCLNPNCRAPFRYLHQGRIFNIESVTSLPGHVEPEHVVETYWLCELCCLSLKVVVENGCVTTRPIHFELPAERTVGERVIPAS